MGSGWKWGAASTIKLGVTGGAGAQTPGWRSRSGTAILVDASPVACIQCAESCSVQLSGPVRCGHSPGLLPGTRHPVQHTLASRCQAKSGLTFHHCVAMNSCRTRRFTNAAISLPVASLTAKASSPKGILNLRLPHSVNLTTKLARTSAGWPHHAPLVCPPKP